MAPSDIDYLNINYLIFFSLFVWAIAQSCKVAYRHYFHPLASFPGPVSHRISRLPHILYLLRGKLPFHVSELHAKYGPVVRIAPSELAFCDPQAWRDIYGHRQPGQEEFAKLKEFYRPLSSTPTSILSADREEHGVIRRQLSHGFSDRSMRDQESIIGSYVQTLIDCLKNNAEDGAKPLNMKEWLNWTTFDIIGDLSFGSSFECLRKNDFHPWVHRMSNANKRTTIFQAVSHLGGGPLLDWAFRNGLSSPHKENRKLMLAKLKQRMELGAARPDLIEGLLKKQGEWQLPIDKIRVNASRLIIAGSETTATLLSGALFLLTSNTNVLAKLTDEVRTAFNANEEITLNSVSNLPYMLACLNETLRLYPPVPIGLPRVSPAGGSMVLGQHVPAGTIVSVWHWAINRSPCFWVDPDDFRPQRFLGDPRYKGDHADAMQPFSLGPRNCIGNNLAYAEMRLILAKIVFNFDMRLANDSSEWMSSQKAFTLWDKPALNIHMIPVQKDSS
ncbi:Cytochrome P450 monooxygenase 1 [Paramyrothecium foliicola]|nr:Cytochrome P450 monooxygenase 1 [Paramyrothecium foliicola]